MVCLVWLILVAVPGMFGMCGFVFYFCYFGICDTHGILVCCIYGMVGNVCISASFSMIGYFIFCTVGVSGLFGMSVLCLCLVCFGMSGMFGICGMLVISGIYGMSGMFIVFGLFAYLYVWYFWCFWYHWFVWNCPCP